MKYTIEEIREVFLSAGGKSSLTGQELLDELEKSKCNPTKGQVYSYIWNMNQYPRFYSWGKHLRPPLNTNYLKPLTTKEAGPECMQHLLDALACVYVNSTSPLKRKKLDKLYAKHKELMK